MNMNETNVARLIVECGKTGICIVNQLLKPVTRRALTQSLHPSQFGGRVGRLKFDGFGVALYRVYR